MSKVIELTHENFEKEVLQSTVPVLVDFWAPWCMPCKLMIPILDELSEELGEKVKIAKLNTEVPAHQDLSAEYQIQSIPNMKLFKTGVVIDEFIGMQPKESLKKVLEKNL